MSFPSNHPEPYSPFILAQEVAHLLGQAFACSKENGRWNDHDGFAVEIHGSKIKLVNAFFGGAYLRQARSPALQPTRSFGVRMRGT